MTKKKPRETHLWQTDLSVFEPLLKAGLFERHVRARARSLAKQSLYILAFAYPIILVTVGVMFGGIVFWTSFAGSLGLMWLVIKRAGYSRNFASWDIGYRKFLGLIGGFGIALALVEGLINIGLLTIPILGGALVAALFLGVWRASNR